MIKPRPKTTTSQDELVFNVIIEYLDDNRTFKLNDIIPFISSRFSKSSTNINLDGIKKSLNTLLKKRLIVEGSKLTKDTVLDNQNRLILFNFIKDNPGYYFNSIVNSVNISKYVVYFHLQILVKFDMIKMTKIENHDIYFDLSIDNDKVKPIYFASKKKSNKILSYLKNDNIGHTKTQISNDLNMHLNTITKYLEILEKCGYIYKEKISGKVLYFIEE